MRAQYDGYRRSVGACAPNAEKVPVGPFLDWLDDVYNDEKARGGKYGERLATKLGLCSTSPAPKEAAAAVRCLYRLRKGIVETRREGRRVVLTATEYPRKEVETLCGNVDGALFEKLYPDLEPAEGADDPFADITLEPDAWCPYCKQNVTPIDGLCPWCMCEHGHIFREVGFTEGGFACLQCAKTGRRAGIASADRLSAAFEGDGVTEEMIERLKNGEVPLPLDRKNAYSQAAKLRGKGLSWTTISYVMKTYHGVDLSENAWRRICGVWQEAA